MTDGSRSPMLLSAATSRLLIVDMQERLLPVIPGAEPLVLACERLIKAAEVLSVPVSCTEQYPKGLGETVERLKQLLPERPAKLRFSCAESLPWATDADAAEGRFQIVIAGIEAHVCVLQTTFDLLAAGFQVAVVVDAVRSRRDLDEQMALQRMSDGGAQVVTSEMVLFEWCEVAGTDQFKQISKLVKG